MPYTDETPRDHESKGESKKQADTAALPSVPTAPILRTAPNRSHPGARLLIVACPYCGHEHVHGDGGLGDDGLGHRAAHCSPPPGTFYRRQRLERQEYEHKQTVDRIVDAYIRGDLTYPEFEKRVTTPLARMRATAAKLEEINTRYSRGEAGYYITKAPHGSATREAGSTQ